MHGTQKSNHRPFLETIGNNHRSFLIAIESSEFFSLNGGHKFCRKLCPILSNCSYNGEILHQKFSSQLQICEEVITGNISPTFLKKVLRALALILNLDLLPRFIYFSSNTSIFSTECDVESHIA